MTTGTRKPGEFCWINILTPNTAQARDFFGKLLGWTYIEMPGMGHRVQVGGRDVGGLFDVVSPQAPDGTPPGIGVMVKVESADATCKKVISLGGTAGAAFDIGEQGRMAECRDPNGAQFDIWEPKKSGGMEADSTLHGVPSWFETITTDPARATKFYTDLFGWTTDVMQMPDGNDYTTFKFNDVGMAGMLKITPETGPMPPFWGVYFTVKNAEDTRREGEKLGATVHIPMHEIAGIGRFCGLMSPQGVMFCVFEYRTA